MMINKQPWRVSCLVPTRNRRAFLPRAIHRFLRQDYPAKELLIVDDGADAVADLIPADDRIRYFRLPEGHSLGAKRNFACQQARGEIILHWDDDDWMADWRISYQVEQLLAHQADVCGLRELFFFDPAAQQAWRYVYPAGLRAWVAGGTLCYRKAFWQAQPFAHLNVGEDTRFLWRQPPGRVLTLARTDFYAALIHPGNTCLKRTSDARYHVWPLAAVREMLGADWDFYADVVKPEQAAALVA